MSLNDSIDQRFLRGYRRSLLGLALAWRTILLVRLELPETVDEFEALINLWARLADVAKASGLRILATA